MSLTSFEGYLHNLVDDEVEDRGRTSRLSRLTLSPRDTERLVDWRRQNQLLRSTFADVVSETVPLALSITTAPRGGGAASIRPEAHSDSFGRRALVSLVGVAAVGAVFALALWPTRLPMAVDLMPTASISSPPPKIDPTNTLRRHVNELAAGDPTLVRDLALPNLDEVGFSLEAARAFDDDPNDVACAIYRSVDRRRVALCATRNDDDASVPDGRVWRVDRTLYTVSGNATDAEATSIGHLLTHRQPARAIRD